LVVGSVDSMFDGISVERNVAFNDSLQEVLLI
jgi:hypothetical protein